MSSVCLTLEVGSAHERGCQRGIGEELFIFYSETGVGTMQGLCKYTHTLLRVRFSPTRVFSPTLVVDGLKGRSSFSLTIVLFFVSSLILPYVPTILASTLVLFLGIELMTEALWESIKSLLWCEYVVVLGTLLACTFVGFAPGFGIGLGLAVVMHFAWCVIDSMPRIQHFVNLRNEYDPSPSASSTVGTSTGKELASISGDLKERTASNSEVSSTIASLGTPTVTFIKLSGYAFFAGIPSLERQMKLPADWKSLSVFVLDFTERSPRRDLRCTILGKESERILIQISVYMLISNEAELYVDGSAKSPSDAESEVKESGFQMLNSTESEVFDEFCRLIGDQDGCLPHSELPVIQRAGQLGVEVRRLSVGDVLAEYEKPLSSIVFVVYGRVTVEKNTLSTGSKACPHYPTLLESLHRSGCSLCRSRQQRFVHLWTKMGCIIHYRRRNDKLLSACKQLMPGDCFGIREYSTGKSDYHRVVVTSGPCWIVDGTYFSTRLLLHGRCVSLPY
ncbi:hypothetical protein BU15DRAFT_63510 [Melanogaster broomeanus]|nr:hypothetical protein BU15DRAFT_63510 [Melanogaster broomeanus]